MPTIYKPPKAKRSNQNKKKEIFDFYNCTRWRRLRLAKLADNPLCEICLSKGVIEPTTDIHHIKKFSEGSTKEEMNELAYSYNNLQSLCSKCHIEIHKTY